MTVEKYQKKTTFCPNSFLLSPGPALPLTFLTELTNLPLEALASALSEKVGEEGEMVCSSVERTASFSVNTSVGILTGAVVVAVVVVIGADAVDVNNVGIAVVNFCAISIIDGNS